ncbi:BadF/BadG/BcrA/BcrD ATPase family protein [Paenibacillus sp. VCA1]|uniref:BadF/BadG/BcrA/BcrD ATPase family protein n=1 Tax=Paenibacillus sp. VCA1 TaxID=3039148 RepID=UPI00287105D0|nr:BadF/BadG/BcrA/BcrD ATPase family protein [Paenibacillus sp. VCA1]MDR9855714.1 BadF/BadG/BcrA/BcrD ATPase family protein [Paenibacillus sp. VCA1]
MMTARVPLLAVDGGGTKCLAVFADIEGRMLASGKAGSCNYQGTGREAAALELTRAIREAKRRLAASATGCKPPASEAESASLEQKEKVNTAEDEPLHVTCAVFGVAGLDTEYDRQVIEGMVREALAQTQVTADRIVVENDGVAALLGATGGAPGILIIAGTGSIVYGINAQGQSARAGGWGHRVGDEGSGYWIGKQAIHAALRGFDGRGGHTALTGKLLLHLGLRNEEELFNWVYSAEYSVDKTAELARLVTVAEREGDETARLILETAADELLLGARSVLNKLGMAAAPFTVILQGGVLQNNLLVRNRLADAFRSVSPLSQIDEAKKEPIYGVIAQGLRLLPHGN